MAVGAVLNIDHFIGDDQRKIAEARAAAEGRWVDRKATGAGPTDRIRFETPPNGGIVNPKREHLKVGQYYFRFVSKALPHKDKVAGQWWVEFDTLNNIYGRFKAAGANEAVKYQGAHADSSPRSSVREWLALTFDWNEIEQIIVAQLWARMDAYTGFGRLAKGPDGKHAGDNRAFGYAPHLSNIFSVKQLYVPGMWDLHEKAFPKPVFFEFSDIDRLIAGELSSQFA